MRPPDSALADAVRAGDPRAVARAISLIEDEAPAGIDLVRVLYPHSGTGYHIGVTGSPGVGKSTLVDRLILEARREGRNVGVVAVDPTSPFTGGAVLGDRVRMGRHAADQAVFIRSMATRGHLGGVARATSDAALILDAAGKDIVVIETIGVGQDEVEIARTADVSVVVIVPGTGDEVQALKAGVMEIADVIVINKADREGADRLVEVITSALSTQPYAEGAWRPPVLKTVATTGAGVPDLWETLGQFRARAAEGATRRRARHEHRLRQLLSHYLLEALEQSLPPGELTRTVDRIAAHEIDPHSAATELVRRAGKANAPSIPGI